MLRCVLHEAKSEVLEKLTEFEAMTTIESSRRVIKLRTDNGGEYVSQEFETYSKSKGIQHEFTVLHSPEQNGVTERMNRTLAESAGAMIAHAHLPNDYWAEAIAIEVYAITEDQQQLLRSIRHHTKGSTGRNQMSPI